MPVGRESADGVARARLLLGSRAVVEPGTLDGASDDIVVDQSLKFFKNNVLRPKLKMILKQRLGSFPISIYF